MSANAVGPPDHKREVVLAPEVRRVVWSSFIGNTVETYDFVLYGSAAALVFGQLFFAGLSPSLALMASFGTFATGYIARPLGGIVFGALGDRIGRKPVLLLTLALMGVGCGLIGLLPTSSQIGAAAPILLILLRLVQGLAFGGEWGGATLMIAEHADPRRRGLYTAIGQAGLPSGALLATLAMAVVTQLPENQLFSWGWRIPFLLSFVLVLVGVYMRRRVSESPLFVEPAATGAVRVRPVHDLVRGNGGALLRGIVAALPGPLSATVFGGFAVSYAVGVGYGRSTVLLALSVGWAVSIATIPLYGLLSDRIGRRRVYVGGAVAYVLAIYPFFQAVNSGSVALLFMAFAVGFGIVAVALGAVIGAVLTELFPTAVRSTGVSTSYQTASMIAGLFPLVATAVLAASGGGTNSQWVTLILLVVVGLAGLSIRSLPENTGQSLQSVGADPAPDESPRSSDSADPLQLRGSSGPGPAVAVRTPLDPK